MIKISVAHDLPQEEAVRRVQGLLGNMKKEHGSKISGLHEKWDGNVGTLHFSVVGLAVSGTITVSDTLVRIVSGDLPFAVRMFKSRIEDKIFEEARQILAKDERAPS